MGDEVTGVDDATRAVTSLLGDRDKRWLLIVGGRASVSSGVPLPFERTRYAASLDDMVRHHLFRSHSRQMFDRLHDPDDWRPPPLGFVGDTLDEQDAWLSKQLEGLTPHIPLLRIADLAKYGAFRAVITNAPDRLIDDAFARVGVEHTKVGIDTPRVEDPDSLPLLREWDNRVYGDSEDRRAREADFVQRQLAAILPSVDGVLIVGHAPTESDLLRGAFDALEAHPDMPVVWVNEILRQGEPTPLPDSIQRAQFEYLETVDLGSFLDALATTRGVLKTEASPDDEPSGTLLSRTMNKSFDVRPVIVFVPGVALLGGLVDKLPRITLKMVISLFALLLAIVAYINYGIWTEYTEQIQPVEDHMGAATKHLNGKDQYQGALLAEVELQEAARKSARVVTPYESIFSIWLVHKKIDEHYETINIDIKTMRDLRVTPVLYRHRFRAQVFADPSRLSLSNHPPVPVHVGVVDDTEDPRGIRYDRKPLSAYRIPKPLAAYAKQQRLALYAPSAALLRVTMQQDMLRELDAGRLAIEVDLSRTPSGPLADYVFDHVGQLAGYVGKRKKLYSPDGVIELLKQGKASFYFSHLEASGAPQNLARIKELLTRFPRSRAMLSIYSAKSRKQIADHAPQFTLLSMSDYQWGDALGFLRAQTSPGFARSIVQDYDLRRSISDPLVLSLLVDYYRFSGVAPRSLAQVYDRLLQNMLRSGSFGYAPKLRVLDALAWESYKTSDNLTREHATRLISGILFRKGSLDKAANLLDEMVADGVLRYRADTYVSFMDPAFQQISAAKFAHSVPAAERARFLLSHSTELTSFYAGLHPQVDPLVMQLTKDYETVRAALKQSGKLLTHVNPYIGALRRAALAAKNGTPDPAVVVHLEQRLFEMLGHASSDVQRDATYGLDSLSSPGVRRWVLEGLESATGNHLRLLMFTALSSEELYVPAVLRWLERVATDADPKKASRFTKRHVNAPDGRSATVESTKEATGRTRAAIKNALTTLAQASTPDSLRAVETLVLRDKDSRFDDKTWRSIRAHGLQLLLDHGQHKVVRRLVPDIEKRPDRWTGLIPKLYVLNDKTTAAALGRILASSSGNKAERTYREGAALSLALMDPEISRGPLGMLVKSAPKNDGKDPLAYVALSLAYRGDPADLPRVTAIVDQVLKHRTDTLARSSEGADYLSRLRQAVSYFGNDKALAVYRKLHANSAWHKRDRGIHSALRYLRSDAAAEFAYEYLLCAAEPPSERALITGLGLMKTRAAHLKLEKLIALLDARSAATLETECPKNPAAALQRVERWKRTHLASFVEALSYHDDDVDVPRLARWVMSDDKAVRGAAQRGLQGFAIPAAGKALFDSASLATATPRDVSGAVRGLGVQGLRANERYVLTLLDEKNAAPYTVLTAAATTGGPESVVRFYPMQSGPRAEQARRAVYFAGLRSLGGTIDRQRLMAAIQ